MLTYGEWLPDLPPTPGTLVQAKNVVARPNGYGPVRSWTALTPELPETFAGGGAFIAADGTSTLIAGTTNKLVSYSGADWDILLTALSAEQWQFTQFGNLVVAVYGEEPQKVDLTAGTAAALGGSPPDASLCATVRDFVWLAGDPNDLITLTISAFNDAEGWTNGVDQSTDQTFPDGGPIMGLVGGEYGLVIQRNAIRRGTYVGGEVIWQFDKIEEEIGAMARGSIVPVGRRVYFLSERGFMVCDGTAAEPIGEEKINRTFFARYSREDIEKITAAVDPRNSLVMWAMPGEPGTLWTYNWVMGRWSTIEMSLIGAFTGFTANISIDALDAEYPGGIDTIPYSLDDPRFSGGNPLLLIANGESAIGTLAGANLVASFSLSEVELIPGRSARISRVRPVSDAIVGTVSMDVRRRSGDSATIKASSDVRASGDVPLRATGRSVRASHTIPAGAVWTYAQGLVPEVALGGSR